MSGSASPGPSSEVLSPGCSLLECEAGEQPPETKKSCEVPSQRTVKRGAQEGWEERTVAIKKIAESLHCPPPTDDKASRFGSVVADHMRGMSQETFLACQLSVLAAIQQHL